MSQMASRKRPRETPTNGESNANPETPTNVLYDKITAIDIQNGSGSGANSNSSFDNDTYSSITDDNNFLPETIQSDSSIKNCPRAVSAN
jgi:hypothetical protein